MKVKKRFKFFREIGETKKGEPLFQNLKTLKFAVDRDSVKLVEIDESELIGLSICSHCGDIKPCPRKDSDGNVLCEECYQWILVFKGGNDGKK